MKIAHCLGVPEWRMGMQVVLETVKHVAAFVLVFSIITNLFSGSRYNRYFRFVQGLIIVLLIMSPLFAWLTEDHFFEDRLDGHILEQENGWEEEELRQIGEQREDLLESDIEAEGR